MTESICHIYYFVQSSYVERSLPERYCIFALQNRTVWFNVSLLSPPVGSRRADARWRHWSTSRASHIVSWKSWAEWETMKPASSDVTKRPEWSDDSILFIDGCSWPVWLMTSLVTLQRLRGANSGTGHSDSKWRTLRLDWNGNQVHSWIFSAKCVEVYIV